MTDTQSGKGTIMRTASWILLLVLSVLILLGGLLSASLAYFGSPEQDLLTESVSVEDVSAGRLEIRTALRGRRATAAAFALGFGVLLLLVVVGPYRRGEKWAGWAVLASSLVVSLVVLGRLIFLDSGRGVAAGVILLGGVVLALLLDWKRFPS